MSCKIQALRVQLCMRQKCRAVAAQFASHQNFFDVESCVSDRLHSGDRTRAKGGTGEGRVRGAFFYLVTDNRFP
jgi:hypothetical protein